MTTASVRRHARAIEDLARFSAYLDDEAGIEVALRFLDAAKVAFARLASLPDVGVGRSFGRPELVGLRMWVIPDFPN